MFATIGIFSFMKALLPGGSHLPHTVVDIILNKMPGLLAEFLSVSKPCPLLFVASLGWMMERMKDSSRLENKGIIEDIFDISGRLTHIKGSAEVAIAKGICFLLLFELSKKGYRVSSK
jgi:hypothetical protein